MFVCLFMGWETECSLTLLRMCWKGSQAVPDCVAYKDPLVHCFDCGGFYGLGIVRTSGNGDTGAEECRPVPTERQTVACKASQAALRASMSEPKSVPQAGCIAQVQRMRKERTLPWPLASDRCSRNNSCQQASPCLTFLRHVF